MATTAPADGRRRTERTARPGRPTDGAVWARVQLARNLRRPRTLELVAAMADDFIELHGDRLFGDDAAIVAGFARIDGRRIVVVGQQKGADTDENIRRNFGMPHPEGYRKAMRVMELAERFGLPVVTFVDVPGAHPGPESEERGIAEAIARSIGLMSRLRTPIVAVITGEGGSGGALAIAVGDVVDRPRERGLLGDQPGGLRLDPVADAGRGADRRRRDADVRRRPAGARRRRHRRAGARRGRPRRPRGDRAAAARDHRRRARRARRRCRSTTWSRRATGATAPSGRTLRSPHPTVAPPVEPGPGRSPPRPARPRPLVDAGRPGGSRDEPPAREEV